MKYRNWISPVLLAGLATGTFTMNVRAQSNVLSPNPKVAGFTAPNILSPELLETIVAQGNMKLENPPLVPPGSPASPFTYYGYNGDGTFLPTGNPSSEATKTEPDKNTYLVLKRQDGPDAHYDYGEHFLFQGHESGLGSPEQGYITRINLDADGPHRVTLMATKDTTGASLPDFDGSAWYPFSEKLLFTAELSGTTGGVWQMSPEFSTSPVVEDLSGALGRGGYEGIQADDRGNLYIVEDSGGPNGTGNLTHARQPNSFVYRFIPSNPGDLKAGGKLQVLQATNPLPSPHAIVFHPGAVNADILSDDVKDLHTYGESFPIQWVTIHDTAINGSTPFDANALAKASGGTPFKRPENGQFRPGSGFSEFIFTETGDTNALTEAGAAYGGFGALFRLRLSGDTGRLSLLYLCDVAHTGFDNLSFWDADNVVVVEDAGDTLHGQRNGLDSAYLFDVRLNYGNPANDPVRILAQGRDASATIDSLVGFAFNDGDNEITGWHQSDGNPTIAGLIGTRIPTPFNNGWRTFYTQQHGDNITWEVLAKNPDEFSGHFKGKGKGNDRDHRDDNRQ